MTRINIVDPQDLSDKHLVAEYRELPRVFTAIKKAISKGKTIDDFPECQTPNYILGKGHVKFFYNKVSWLRDRYANIVCEMQFRGFHPKANIFQSVLVDSAMLVGTEWDSCLAWKPVMFDKERNYKRLVVRDTMNHYTKRTYFEVVYYEE